MARAKVTVDSEDIQEAVEERAKELALGLQLDGEDEPDPDELRALRELGAGSDVRWTVFRQSDMGGKRAGHCGTLSTSELTLDRIASEWGIGKYKIRGTRSNGQFAGQSTVTIAEEPKKPDAAAAQPAHNPMTEFLTLMEAQSAKRSAEMKEWAMILVPLATAVLPAILGRQNQPAGPTLADLTTTMMNMRSLSAPESGTSKFKELKEMLELTREMKPEDNTGSTWVDLIRDGVKELAPIVPAMMHAAQNRNAPPAAATPAAQSGAAAARPQVTQGEPDMLAWLKQQLQGLVHQASLNKDPSLYAEVVLDNLPEGADPKQLRDFLGGKTWWETLLAFHPPVAPYRKWFVDCRKELLSGLDEMLGVPGAPPHPPEKSSSQMPTDDGAQTDGE